MTCAPAPILSPASCLGDLRTSATFFHTALAPLVFFSSLFFYKRLPGPCLPVSLAPAALPRLSSTPLTAAPCTPSASTGACARGWAPVALLALPTKVTTLRCHTDLQVKFIYVVIHSSGRHPQGSMPPSCSVVSITCSMRHAGGWRGRGVAATAATLAARVEARNSLACMTRRAAAGLQLLEGEASGQPDQQAQPGTAASALPLHPAVPPRRCGAAAGTAHWCRLCMFSSVGQCVKSSICFAQRARPTWSFKPACFARSFAGVIVTIPDQL